MATRGRRGPARHSSVARRVLRATAVALAASAAGAASAPAADPPVAGTLDLARLAAEGSTAAGADARVTGPSAAGRAGQAVAFAGDLDGDGRQDLAIGDPRSGPGGAVAVVFGPATSGEPLRLPLEGTRGLELVGPGPGAGAGSSVAAAGDVDGDGFDDLLVGAPGAVVEGRGAAGSAYLVRGGRRPASGRVTLAEAGIRLAGAAAGDGTGRSVASTGDLDGDGRPELVVGAPGADGLDRANAGAVFVVSSRGLAGGVDLAAADGRSLRIDGAQPGSAAGTSVAGVGDMDGDGRAEVVAGAPGLGGGAGAAHVVLGRPPAVAGPVDLAQPGGGFTTIGAPGERAGAAVAGLGDATGDGRPDIAVGAPLSAWTGRPRAGAAYVVAGRPDSPSGPVPLAGLRVGGGDPGEQLGASVASAGDVDRDGRADLLAGVPGDRALGRRLAGSAVLVLTGRAGAPDVDAGLLGHAGVRLAGPHAGGRAGTAVAGGVDADRDGRPDVLVGHPRPATDSGAAGGASLALLPAVPAAPVVPPAAAPALARTTEVVVDDSASMRRRDPGGVLRRQALELVLTTQGDPARVFGAVEFGTYPHQVLPPVLVGGDVVRGDRLLVLRDLLAERIANDAGTTRFEAGFAAAAVHNPRAEARIFLTDGGQTRDLVGFGDVRTYVIGLDVGTAARAKLAALAEQTGGRLHVVRDAGGMQAALAAIDAELRGDATLKPTVDTSPPGISAAPDGAPGVTAVAVEGRRRFEIAAGLSEARARDVQRARLVTTWNRRTTRFVLDRLRFRVGAREVRVSRRALRRALRGRWVSVGRGIGVRGRRSRTYLVLEVRGLRRASASRGARAAGVPVRVFAGIRRTRGGRRAVARSVWTYQRRPR